MEGRKVISAHQVEKTAEWGKDVFDNPVMAISEIKAQRLEQQIVLDEWEQENLFKALKEKFDIPVSGPDPTEDIEEDIDLEDEEPPKYLIIESRLSGGKKRKVPYWCEDADAALEYLREIYNRNELTSVEELSEFASIVEYQELTPPEELWEDEGK